MNHFLCFAVFVLLLGNVSLSYGQVERALNYPGSEEWLNQKRAMMDNDLMAEQSIINHLSRRQKKFLDHYTIGRREIEVERKFFKIGLLSSRFKNDPDKNYQWRLLMTDVVAIGRVAEINPETEICGYGTSIVINIAKSIKGNPGDNVSVKIVSGRKLPNGHRIVIPQEPSFELGEEVLIFLTRVPFRLHSELIKYPCSENKELFYLTQLTGPSFELGLAGGKLKIEDGNVKWRGNKISLVDFENQIIIDQDAKF